MFNFNSISVNDFLNIVKRSGSIDNRRTSSHTPQEGTRIHQQIQDSYLSNYTKEVYISHHVVIDGIDLDINGRMDGLITFNDQYIVDEIKTSETDFDKLDQSRIDRYFYQGMCYAYFLAFDKQLESVGVQLTYYQTTDKEITKTIKEFTFEELESFFYDLINDYKKWLHFLQQWQVTKNESMLHLTFPYQEYRLGQYDLSKIVYKSILSKRNLFIEAPTGVGKTISTLFPAMKAIPNLHINKIFYLTAKTITRSVVLETLQEFNQAQLRLKSVVFYAKDKICFLDKRDCNPDKCIYAKDYYDKLNACIYEMITSHDTFDKTLLEEYALKHEVCPFELSLDLSLFCDLIVCDYNYLFNPHVYLKRFFETKNNPYIFLIDEAHNLVDRSRDMYSASLSRHSMRQLINFKFRRKKLKQMVIDINEEIDSLLSNLNQEIQVNKQANFLLNHSLILLSEQLSKWLLDNQKNQYHEQVLEIFFEINQYIKISELYNEGYVTIIDKNKDTFIKQYCIDPHDLVKDNLDKALSSIIFSATLSPIAYYKDIIGGTKNDLEYIVDSPFDSNNFKIIVDETINTSYKYRERSASKLVETLKNYIDSKQGNYMFFFPSYKYLNDIYPLFEKVIDSNTLLIKQELDMDEQQREAFLDIYRNNKHKTLVGFCVMGGVFSEGINLKGDLLIGTAIISVGLPMINFEQDLIKDYYQHKNNKGFLYAYNIPGMNKVIQSAGRVIRTNEDKGSLLLIDQRFNQDLYASLMPQHWQHRLIASNNLQMINELQAFNNEI